MQNPWRSLFTSGPWRSIPSRWPTENNHESEARGSGRSGRQARSTATRHPAMTWAKPPDGNSPSRHGANAQVKRQAKPARHVLARDQSHRILGFAPGWTGRDWRGESNKLNSGHDTFVSSKATVNVIGPKAIPRDTEGSPQVNPVRIHPAQGNLPGSAENP